MNTAANSEPRIASFKVTKDEIIAQLTDGRTISVPLAWSWRLSDASPEQRNKFKILGNGQGVHWHELDEDISARGMLSGVPARRPQAAAKKSTRTTRASHKPSKIAA